MPMAAFMTKVSARLQYGNSPCRFLHFPLLPNGNAAEHAAFVT
jgi:hypothetical protein